MSENDAAGPESGAPETSAPQAADGRRPVTGDAAVDAVTAQVDQVVEQPLREHVSGFDAIHRALADRLAEPGE